MHTYIIHTTYIALCYCNMLRPSNGNLRGLRLIHFHIQINKMCSKCKIQFNEQLV